MTKYSLLLLLLSAVCTRLAEGAELAQAADPTLTSLLNRLEIVAEQKRAPIAVRLFRIRNLGECDGTPATCPKEDFYIAVSTIDEAPTERLFVLPKSYGWQFVAWNHIPKEEGPSHFVEIELQEKAISPNPEKKWWSETRYKLRVNRRKRYIEAAIPSR